MAKLIPLMNPKMVNRFRENLIMIMIMLSISALVVYIS
jgi:hypothetical protein